jgi:hypothetical protein
LDCLWVALSASTFLGGWCDPLPPFFFDEPAVCGYLAVRRCGLSTVLLTGETARRADGLELFGWDIEDFVVLLLQAAAANLGVLVLPHRKNVAMWGSDLDSTHAFFSDRWIKHGAKSKWNRS